MSYQLTHNGSVVRLEDNTFITVPSENLEYAEYLAWLDQGNEPLPAPVPPEPTIEELRQAKMDAVTAKRWDVMTGGLVLPNGVAVGTEIDDQNRITSVVANAELAGLTDADTVDFKATSGWVSLTIGEIKSLAGVIGQFVQACFSSERSHHDAIALLEEAEDIDAYDVDQGWPDTDLRPSAEEPEE